VNFMDVNTLSSQRAIPADTAVFFAKFLSEKQPLLISSNIVYIPLLTDWGLFALTISFDVNSVRATRISV